MKTIAMIAALSVAASLALAATHRGSARPAPVPLQNANGFSNESSLSYAPLAMRATSGCVDAEVMIWFATEPRPIENACPLELGLLCLPPEAADVNDDGTDEHFYVVPCSQVDLSSPNCAIAEPWGPGLGVIWSRIDAVGGSLTARHTFVRILGDLTAFDAWIQTRHPGFNRRWLFHSMTFTPSPRAGWRDVDGDGDLDYLLNISGDNYGSGAPYAQFQEQIWFENIGYEKAVPPVAADLNRDGQVDGADLGMLLFAWGPNR